MGEGVEVENEVENIVFRKISAKKSRVFDAVVNCRNGNATVLRGETLLKSPQFPSTLPLRCPVISNTH